MAGKWVKRIGVTVLLAGVAVAAVLHFDRATAVGKADAVPAATAQPAAPTARELAAIEVTRIEPRTLTERLTVSGELQPVNRAVVKAKVAGTVLEVTARPGDSVKSGQVLARFETNDLESTLAQRDSNVAAARAQLSLAEQTLAKTQELSQRGFATRAAFEKSQSDVASARANLQGMLAQTDTAKSALRNAELIAPFDGIVSARSIEPGETVAANAQLMTVVDTTVLEASVLVSTRDITKLKVGQTSELRVDGVPGGAVVGTVDRITPVANAGSRFVPVYIRLENTDGRLFGGMFATGTILVREAQNVLAVPQTAIRTDGENSYVLRLADGKLQRSNVTLGAGWDGGRLVGLTDGVAAGDTVLSAPLPELGDGTPVVVSSVN